MSRGKPKYRYVQGVQCSLCMDRIWSRYRHDFRKCKCGKVFVDGGRSYLHCGYECGAEPIPVKIRVTNEEYEMDGQYERQSRWPY